MRSYFISIFLIFYCAYVSSKPLCFSQPAYPRPPLFPAGLSDCLFMTQLLLKGDKAHAPMHWGRDKHAGFRLPTMWDVWGKSCFITMDMLPEYEDEEVVFPPDAVAKVAVDIINYCQTSSRLPRLGGRETVGPEHKTIVILAGKIPETGPKPPGSPILRVLPGLRNSSIDIS